MNSTISNTLRALFGSIALLVAIGMMLSDEPSLILWVPFLGLVFAAATGRCLMLPILGKALQKLDIER